MGKGDAKSFTGKLFRKSYGKYRYRRKKRKTHKKIPATLISALKPYISANINKAEHKYEVNCNDENSLTGALLDNIEVMDWQCCDGWKWKINSKRLKSIKEEPFIGADGIISINIEQNGRVDNKSILFQAKRKENIKEKEIMEQIEKMKKGLPNGNMIIVYAENGYYAQTGNDYGKNNMISLTDFLFDVFLACKQGVWGKTYDDVKKYCDLMYKMDIYAKKVK
ncbi:MAG: 30S ribosomal protein THX [Prevotellaceae bacterium]|jgi:ribosomal small subunit protein bTHX|nr:30S ribosomal protein THX [Prevotellaceae bacterium]